MRVKLVALRSALVILALFTLLGAVLLFRDEGMDWDWGISILIAWWMTIVIAAAGTVFAAGRLRLLMGITIISGVVLVGLLYSGTEGEWPFTWGIWFGAVALVQIGLLSLLDIRASRVARLVRVGTFATASVLAVGFFGQASDVIELESPYEDWFQRLLIFICMVNAAGTVGTYLLAAMESLQRPPVESLPSNVALSATCPRCNAANTFPVGKSACTSCDLRVTLDIQEPRCPCGYLLYKLDSPNCPECGRLVRGNAAAPATDSRDIVAAAK